MIGYCCDLYKYLRGYSRVWQCVSYKACRVSLFTIQLFSWYGFQEQNICTSRGPPFGRLALKWSQDICSSISSTESRLYHWNILAPSHEVQALLERWTLNLRPLIWADSKQLAFVATYVAHLRSPIFSEGVQFILCTKVAHAILARDSGDYWTSWHQHCTDSSKLGESLSAFDLDVHGQTAVAHDDASPIIFWCWSVIHGLSPPSLPSLPHLQRLPFHEGIMAGGGMSLSSVPLLFNLFFVL